MESVFYGSIPKSPRISKLIAHLYENLPEIESARAKIVTASYQATEGLPIITRRAKCFEAICRELPIIIRPSELIVGSNTIAPRGCQTFPEYSYAWLEAEFDTVEHRAADPFYISPQTKQELRALHPYWKGKTTSELATSYMAPEALRSIEHNVFTPGNYFYNGIGHICVKYEEVLSIGYEGIRETAQRQLSKCHLGDGDYARRAAFLNAVICCCDAACTYGKRYAVLAAEEAARCSDPARKAELQTISAVCQQVPAKGARSFREACQSFWFVQMLIQTESSGHSISPGRFDQYMYPYYKKDLDSGKITQEAAQELLDCIWVKFNDLNKCRDAVSAEGFAGYSLFQNLIVGGQNTEGEDVTNDLSAMCLEADMHVQLPAPSLCIRVWNGTPHNLMIKAAELVRTGVGHPAYYNDEVIIPALLNRGLTLADARDYCIIGCVEPQKSGKTDGWHDAAFFNMCRPMEFVFTNGTDHGVQVGPQTGDVEQFTDFQQFCDAYQTQLEYQIELLVNADNAIDTAHSALCPLPYLSSMVDDCLDTGLSVQEGGSHYNFTGPQGFGIANNADGLYAIRELVFRQKKYTLGDFKRALAVNFGQGLPPEDAAALAIQVTEQLQENGVAVTAQEIAAIVENTLTGGVSPEQQQFYQQLLEEIKTLPKFGNDIDEVDALARQVGTGYSRPLEQYKNPRGGQYQAGLYPVSANVPLGRQTGATPDGRLARTPIADGVSPAQGRDANGPTAAALSVAKLDHFSASNGTLYNQKFHPSALEGRAGLETFTALIRGFFDQKGMHIQFNVVSRDTLLDAQQHPENYQHLVVRVAGYSALWNTLSKSLQDDIIARTEQGWSE